MSDAKTWWEQYAEKAGVRVNPDEEVREGVLNGLEFNRLAFRARYCPSVPDFARKSDAVCPCRPMRECGKCQCGLFLAKQLLA